MSLSVEVWAANLINLALEDGALGKPKRCRARNDLLWAASHWPHLSIYHTSRILEMNPREASDRLSGLIKKVRKHAEFHFTKL